MNLSIIGSNSLGNAYALHNENECLLIECGMPRKMVFNAIDWKISTIVGCLLTHDHGDHTKHIKEYLDRGIDIYSSELTHKEIGTQNHHRSKFIKSGIEFKIGNFTILPFNVQHDAADPLGFFIHHNECGNVLFVTDSYYVSYTFKGLNNIIVEANYSNAIIKAKQDAGELPKFLKDRVIQSHMSIETCSQLLKANDITKVNNIVLIHLSDRNSNAIEFKQTIENETGKSVHIANRGMKLLFNKTNF